MISRQSTFCVSFTTVSQLFNSQEITVIFSTPSMCRFRYVPVITEKRTVFSFRVMSNSFCTFSNHSCATFELPTNITERMEAIWENTYIRHQHKPKAGQFWVLQAPLHLTATSLLHKWHPLRTVVISQQNVPSSTVSPCTVQWQAELYKEIFIT